MLHPMKMKTAMLAGALAAPILMQSCSRRRSPPRPGRSPAPGVDSFSYRVAGDFSRAGRPVEGPLRERRLPGDLMIMKRQVTVAEYRALRRRRRLPAHRRSGEAHRTSHRRRQLARCLGLRRVDDRARPASPIVCRPTRSGHSQPPRRRATKRCRWSIPPIRRRPGSPATKPNPPAPGPSRRPPQPVGTFGTNSNGLDDLGRQRLGVDE